MLRESSESNLHQDDQVRVIRFVFRNGVSKKWDTWPKKPRNVIERFAVPLSRNSLTALSQESPLGSANDFNKLIGIANYLGGIWEDFGE